MTAIQIPARLITTGDHFWGYVVSEIKLQQQDAVGGGYRQFKLVVPYTTNVIFIRVFEKDLDEISFPVDKRGDDYSPNERNAALGLPLVQPKPYVAPEPIAVYPAGTKIGDVKHFDRSMKVVFHCPIHEHSVYMSKDPFSSSWFSLSEVDDRCPEGCDSPTRELIVHEDYKPTRNG